LIILSRRFGQPISTMVGIYHSNSDFCVTIDVDLQDPPELMLEMYHKIQQGYDVVFVKRLLRKGDPWIKKMVAKMGYRTINRLSDVPIPNDVGDFRMMSRRVVD